MRVRRLVVEQTYASESPVMLFELYNWTIQLALTMNENTWTANYKL